MLRRVRLQAPSSVACGFAIVCFLGIPSLVFAGRIGYVADELIIEAREGVSSTDLSNLLSNQGLAPSPAKPIFSGDRSGPVIVQVSAQRLEAVASDLARNPKVKSVSRNYIYTPDLTPNDTYYPQQWSLIKIGAPDAWDVSQGRTDVVIAILDSGVAPTHPDLSSKLVTGYNIYSNNADTTDVFGHGTEVAGVAAAVPDNGIGVAGLAWNNNVMPVRITDAKGFGYSSTISSGLRWAVNHGAKVMNISFSQIVGDSAIEAASRYVRSKGGLVVAAAGNCGCQDTAADSPYILSVAATDSQDRSASFTSYGSFVDLSAPGVGMVSTTMSGGYGWVSGTSFSSPLTAALAALIFSIDPSFTPDQVESILVESAEPVGGAGWNDHFGWGRINATKSVQAAVALRDGLNAGAPSIELVLPAQGAVVQGTVTLRAAVTNDTGASAVQFYVDGAEVGTGTTDPFEIVWDSTTVTDGMHTISARATDTSGNTGVSLDIGIVVANTGQGPPSAESGSSQTSSSSGSGGGGCGVVTSPRGSRSPGSGGAAAMAASLSAPLLWQLYRRARRRIVA